MKGIIIQQPHISRIIDGLKIWEIRTRNTTQRVRIALIESGLTSVQRKKLGLKSTAEWSESRVLGTASLSDVIEFNSNEICKDEYFQCHRIPTKDMTKYVKRDKSAFAWILTDVLKFDTPLIVRIKRGIVNWPTLTNAVEIREKQELNLIM